MNGPGASVTANGQVPYSYEMEKFYFEIEILEIEGDVGFGTTCMASVHYFFYPLDRMLLVHGSSTSRPRTTTDWGPPTTLGTVTAR